MSAIISFTVCFLILVNAHFNHLLSDNIPDTVYIANQLVVLEEEGKKRILEKYRSLRKSNAFYTEYLHRVSSNISEVNNVLNTYKLHTDLAYIAVLESHLNPNAVSKTGAVGVWQFKYETAYEMGLIHKTDKRNDIFASTHAAAQYFMHHLNYLEQDYLKVILAHHLGLFGTLEFMKKNNIEDLSIINESTHIYLIHYLAHYLVMDNALRQKMKS